MVQDEIEAITKYLLFKLGIKRDREFQGHQFENVKCTESPQLDRLSERQKSTIFVGDMT